MNNPKVLIFDIETTPMTVYTWGTRDQNIALNQIKKEWSVIAFAAKWSGEPASKTVYYDLRKAKDIENDKPLLLHMWKLLDEADIVITQNGKNFDSPKLNARFILNDMKPPSPYKHLDTYQIVKRVAKFTSNKLEYLTDKLCTKYKKLSHKKYPGFSLWTECMKGNIDAWNEMKRYNIHDVLATEEFYEKIKAWAPENMPKPFYWSKGDCTTCGGRGTVFANGTRQTRKRHYQRLLCGSCGAHSKGVEISNGR